MENFKIFFYIFFFVHEHILTHNLNREYYHIEMDKNDISRIIEMAWEDRTPFDAIEKQFIPGNGGAAGLNPNKISQKSVE